MKTFVSKKRGCRYWRNLFLVGLAGSFVGLLFIVYVGFPILVTKGAAHPKRAPVCCYTPSDLGLEYEDVSFTTSDGVTLRGWYIPSENGAAVITAHVGLANRLGHHIRPAVALAERGYGVLLFDLRAHGESGGDTITFGGEDVLGAVAYLQSQEDVDRGQIGALGLSYGGLVVIQAAASTKDIKAVVAEGASPAEFQDAPQPENLEDWLMVPYEWMWFIGFKLQGVSAPMSLTKALAQIAPRPILLISGAQDRIDRRLVQHYYAFAGEPKELWEVSGAGHVGGWASQPEEYEARIVAFFEQALLGNE